MQRSWLILRSACGFSWCRRPRSIVAGVVCIPEVGLRHREPQSGEKLKASVARVRRDFGPLVQNAGQAQGNHGSDPFASLLARKIRERLIRHSISHRVGRNASWDSLSSPGLCMPLGRKWARRIGAGKIGKVTVSFQCPPFTCYFSMDPNKQRAAKCMPVVLNVSSLQRSRIAKPWLCVARDKPRLGSQGPRSPRYLVPAQQRRRGH